MSSEDVAPNTAEFLLESHYRLSTLQGRCVQAQLLLAPIVLGACVWLSQSSHLLLLLLLEVLLTSAFAVNEARKRRESARKTALSITILNTFLICVAGGISQSVLLIALGSIFGVAAALLLQSGFGKRMTLGFSWLLFLSASAIGVGLPVFGQAQVENAAKELESKDWSAAAESLQRAKALLWIKGATPLERAIVGIRKAEAELRSGDTKEASATLDSIEVLTLNLPAPIEGEGNDLRLRDSLAFLIYSKGVLGMRARIFAFERWGHQPGFNGDVIGEYDFYPSDELGWARSLLDPERFIVPDEVKIPAPQ